MKEFQVTVMFEGKLETLTMYGNSVKDVKKRLKDYWIVEQISEAKIVNVLPVKRK